MNKGVYHTDVNMVCHKKMLWKININIMDYHMKYTNYCICYQYHYVLKCKNEKCIWKIFVKYTQIHQSNTNTNTNISSCGFSNTNTNTDICVFKYKYKYKYVFDPSPGWCKYHGPFKCTVWISLKNENHYYANSIVVVMTSILPFSVLFIHS